MNRPSSATVRQGLDQQQAALRMLPAPEHPKEAVKLRLDHDVVAAYRRTGRGWQTRINTDLRKAARKLMG